MRALSAPFRVSEESRCALFIFESPFSVLVVDTFFPVSTRHVDMAFLVASISIISFISSLFYILRGFSSSSRWSHSSSTLSSISRKLDCSAIPSKKDSILPSIPGATEPVAKLLLESIPGHELRAASTSSEETRALRCLALPQLRGNGACDFLDLLCYVVHVTFCKRMLFLHR